MCSYSGSIVRSPRTSGRRYSKIMISALFIAVITSISGRVHAGETSPKTDARDDAVDVDHLLLTIQEVCGDPLYLIFVDNSEISLHSRGIEKIVKSGARELRDLVRIMKVKKCSFDTFTRCYSACNQIVLKELPGNRVLWYGGCRRKKDSLRGIRIHPRFQNVSKLRNEVINDVVAKMREIERRKKKKSD